MAFQSRTVLWYVQVTKKLDIWQEKNEKAVHQAVALLHIRPHEPVMAQPNRGRRTETGEA